LHVGDVTSKDSMRGGMDSIDGIFHTAGWYKLDDRDRQSAMRINVDGTRNVLELMEETHVPKGVYTSTVAVFSDTRGALVDESYQFTGRHLTQYDYSKWLAHYQVALPMIERGLPLTIVLPGLVYGPGDASPVHELFEQYLKGTLTAVPRQTALCWSHVDDVARGHILAMERGLPGESYILTGEAHTLSEVLQIAARITGIAPPRRVVSPRILYALAVLSRIVGAMYPLPPAFRYERMRIMAGATYLASNAKARRDLGFEPRSVEEGLRETLRHMQRAETAPTTPPTA
jgi:nucleoside-diphosphate-sugar epimerase